MGILTVSALVWVVIGGQASPQSGFAAPAQCLPRDQAAQKPDFFSFRAQLQMAVARRDLRAVLAATDPQIRTSFGSDDGLASFRRQLSDPAGQAWEELASVLALGGWFQDDLTFRAPYTDSCGGGDDVIVIASDVRVRSKPSSTASALSSVSFEVLRGQWAKDGWVEVQLQDGRKGFVAEALVRSPIGYRAWFIRVQGLWKMTAFIAGD